MGAVTREEETRGVMIPTLDPAPESDFNSFWDMAIPIPDPDPGKSGFVTAIEVL